MASRRKGPKELSQAELELFLKKAEELHNAICRPIIRTTSPQFWPLKDLNQAICEAIIKITGKDPVWVQSSIRPSRLPDPKSGDPSKPNGSP